MRHVVWSLLPVCAFFVWQYGVSALASLLVVTASCLTAEAFFLKLGKQSGDLADWSATITGLLLALTLPPGFPLWMGAVAGFVAIALGKAIFGGVGHNLFNPALVGRAFAQGAFPTAIAAYTPSFLPTASSSSCPRASPCRSWRPGDTTAWIAALHIDGVSSATPLARWKFEGVVASSLDLLSLPLRPHGGRPRARADPRLRPLSRHPRLSRLAHPRRRDGQRRRARRRALSVQPAHYPDPLFVLFSGGLVLGAVYMATDMVTSPVTPLGMWVYGALIGVLTVVIRFTGGLPEGVMYAI